MANRETSSVIDMDPGSIWTAMPDSVKGARNPRLRISGQAPSVEGNRREDSAHKT
jgi:hypothetical protein